MEDELAVLIEEMRQIAFEAKCEATRAQSAEPRRFWAEAAARWESIADDYARVRLRSLN